MASYEYGAVVMMDALVFKGIWQHHQLDPVLRRLRLLEEIFDEFGQSFQTMVAGALGFRTRVTFLSDTIVVACYQERLEGRLVLSSGLVAIALGLAGYAYHAGASDIRNGEPVDAPLAFRGAISFGEFYLDERYLVGPAIDDAAAWMNRPQGALVMLTPSALKEYVAASSPAHACRWNVPLDKEDFLATWVASPFAHDNGGPETKWEIADLILGTFDKDGAPSKVRAVYKPNTHAFLEEAFKQWNASRPR